MAHRGKMIAGIVCLTVVLFAGFAALWEIYSQGGRVLSALFWIKDFSHNAAEVVKGFFTGIEKEVREKHALRMHPPEAG